MSEEFNHILSPKYFIGPLIGEGGFANVYRATEKKTLK